MEERGVGSCDVYVWKNETCKKLTLKNLTN